MFNYVHFALVCCRYLLLFTEIPTEEIMKLQDLNGAELNAAKVLLADETTRLLHGPGVLQSIHTTAQGLFAQTKQTSETDLSSLPVFDVNKSELADGSATIQNLFLRAKLAESKSAVRRLIQGGGVKVNDVKLTDEGYCLSQSDFDIGGHVKLSSGKKTHVLLRLIE